MVIKDSIEVFLDKRCGVFSTRTVQDQEGNIQKCIIAVLVAFVPCWPEEVREEIEESRKPGGIHVDSGIDVNIIS